jgi:7-cyano-7-deazaguanine synthase
MQNHKKKAVVLLSGGLDSATIMAIAGQENHNLYALSFDYGQRHKVELEAAKKIAKSFGAIEHKIAQIDLRVFGGSALTADIDVPKNRIDIENQAMGKNIPSGEGGCLSGSENRARGENIPSGEGGCLSGSENRARGENIPITYVPARNAIFLAYSLGYAEVIGAQDIFIGVNAVDYSGYPDCRIEFIKAFEKMANLATAVGVGGSKINIKTPLINLSKKEIIQTGLKLKVDYSIAHSCYDPIIKNNQVYGCGHCDSCLLRLKGFAENNSIDPYKYWDAVVK